MKYFVDEKRPESVANVKKAQNILSHNIEIVNFKAINNVKEIKLQNRSLN